MKSTIDKLINELHDRSIRLSSLNERFGFLLDPVNLINSDVNYLQEKVRVFSTFYKDDVNQSDLMDEIMDIKMLLIHREKPQTAVELLKFVIGYGGEDAIFLMRQLH